MIDESHSATDAYLKVPERIARMSGRCTEQLINPPPTCRLMRNELHSHPDSEPLLSLIYYPLSRVASLIRRSADERGVSQFTPGQVRRKPSFLALWIDSRGQADMWNPLLPQLFAERRPMYPTRTTSTAWHSRLLVWQTARGPGL